MIIENLNNEPLDDNRLRGGDTHIWGDDEHNMWHVETWDGNEMTDDRTYEQLDDALEDAKEREYMRGVVDSLKTEEDILIDKVIAQMEDSRDRRRAEAELKEKEYQQVAEKHVSVLEQLQRVTTKIVNAAFNDLEQPGGPHLHFYDDVKKAIDNTPVIVCNVLQHNMQCKSGKIPTIVPRSGARLTVYPSGEFCLYSKTDSYQHYGLTEFVQWLALNIMKNGL